MGLLTENPQLSSSAIPDFPRTGHYRVIYADPPWTFVTRSPKGKGRSAERHYGLHDHRRHHGAPRRLLGR